MCNHSNKRKINSMWVCLKCGLTTTEDGKIMFDKTIVKYCAKKKKKAVKK